ncbi:MAG: hypothetical protein Q9209_001944 [Squamulea sp. 1 TL-2023]
MAHPSLRGRDLDEVLIPKGDWLSIFHVPSDNTDPDKREVEELARHRVWLRTTHNMAPYGDDKDLGDDPEFRADSVSAGMRLKYSVPTSFKEELAAEFHHWYAHDTEIRIIEALDDRDRKYFLQSKAKGNLRQFVIWRFFYKRWLVNNNKLKPEQDFQLYWRSKRFAEVDYESEVSMLVKEKWDLR